MKNLGELLPGRIDGHVRLRPEQVAVECGNRKLTYRQLDCDAQAIAVELKKAGVGRESIVAVLTDRSAQLPVAIFGIWKAGAAYLPLEPGQPAARIEFMLRDSGAKAILVERAFVSQVPVSDLPVLIVEDAIAKGAPVGFESELVEPTSLAYLIYTSGSTGSPKGVEVEHGGIANSLGWVTGEMEIKPADVFLNVLTPCFDMSVFSLFLPLSNGARLVMASESDSRNADRIRSLLETRNVTVMKATPVTWTMLIEAGWTGNPTFKAAIGGEALTRSLANAIVTRTRGLWNLYGPTEASVFCIGERMESGDGPVPIGKPIANMRAYILDDQSLPAPNGETGELYVSGIGVARGYRNRPELNDERFSSDLFSPTGTGRMYRTGDLARRRDDGVIEYLGRTDDQVKIRGYRVEPQEVEAVLIAQPEVLQCAVITREEGDLRHLVAYYSLRKCCAIPAEGFRARLARALPEYLIPARFIEVPEIPLNSNGKVNRGELAKWTPTEVAVESDAPSSELESALCEIAKKLLNLPALGCNADLFELGMHSLLAVRFAVAIAEELGIKPGISDIFEGRTVAAIAARLAAQPTPTEEMIPLADRSAEIPLTWQQEQIWYLTRIAPQSQAYNAQFTLRLTGPLDLNALISVQRKIVERHEIFRTTFHDGANGPVQRVHPGWGPQVDVIDVPDVESAEQAIATQCRHLFDCSKLPLIKWVIFRLSSNDHILLHVEHHLVHDGWEVAVLVRELQEFYCAAVENRTPALPDLPIQYADYAAWQRSYLSGDRLSEKVAHWEQRLSGYPRVLQLPADHDRPPVSTFRGDLLRVDLDRELYSALRDFSRRRKVTLFVTMYSAFVVLMSRYTGQQRLLLGTGIANRSRRETEGMLGMFINPALLTADLTADPRFEELLAESQRRMIEDLPYYDTPFSELVRRLKVEQSRDRNPLVQVLFAFHDNAVPVPDFAGLTGSLMERNNGSAKMDVNLVCVPRAEQRIGQRSRASDEDLTLCCEYNTDLFDRTTIQRLLASYLHLLEEALHAPDKRISELQIMPGVERDRILAFNPTPVAYDRDWTLWELFEERARQYPDKSAIVSGGTRVTYAQLLSQAERVSTAISRTPEGRPQPPGFAVALCMSRSPWMVAAMLGVTRCGGAYVPIPPHYPQKRVQLMIQDAAAAAILTDSDLKTILHAPETEKTACARPSASDPAYIIYTSGSTGAPKGTLVPHRAVHNLTLSFARDLLSPDDVVVQLADPAFDATIFEIWGTLLLGATIAFPEDGAVTDPERLEAALQRDHVTAAFLTTALFNLIADLRPRALDGLRTLAMGGEKINVGAVRRVMTGAPSSFRLWHVYGPTECTCFSTGNLCTSDQLASGTLPIGKPLINYSAYVLDENRQLAPIGVPGELYIGGDSLAIGYINGPELTKERFIENPFASDGSRFYRTGDIVRWDDAGNLEFVGRRDHQLKVRGFRVELGEVEAALAKYPGVRQAVVTAQEEHGVKQLIAWTSPANHSQPSAADLRNFLQESLPPYMIPSRFVILDYLPLTPAGKIDRPALALPPAEIPTPLEDEISSPLTAQLIQIWEELLQVQPIGINQDFFALGGHSLLSVRLMSRIATLFGRKLPVSTLFAAPTIRQLADVLLAEKSWMQNPPIQVQPGDQRSPIFFFDGDWLGGGLYCRNLARLIDPSRAFYAIPPHGLDDGDVPASVEAMATDRLHGLLSIQREGPFTLCGYCAGGLVALEMAHQLEAKGFAVDSIVLIDSVADAAGDLALRRLRRRFKPWIDTDWAGRAALLGQAIKERLDPVAPEPEGDNSDETTFDWNRGAAGEYIRAVMNYRLKPYAGRVTLIFTKDSTWELNPESPWRKTATALDVKWVPGDHTTSLAAHAPITAAAIRASLNDH